MSDTDPLVQSLCHNRKQVNHNYFFPLIDQSWQRNLAAIFNVLSMTKNISPPVSVTALMPSFLKENFASESDGDVLVGRVAYQANRWT